MTRPDSLFDRALCRVQFALQGWPNKRRPWFLERLGNRIADYRFWRWETRGGTHAIDWAEAVSEIRTLGTNGATNVPREWRGE